MIVYRKTSGRAHNARLVEDNYQLQDGELSLPGWEIPALDTLHDPVDPKVAHNADIIAQIVALEEVSGFTRRQREFLKASVPAAAALDAQIAAKRAELLK